MPDHKISKVIVEVLSARRLPKPGQLELGKGDVIDPFVVLEMHGVPEDCRNYKTKTIIDNGFNPDWNETFEFPLVHSATAILLIMVCDHTNRIGHYAIPVHSILQGYRYVPLLDDNTDSKKIAFASLFCKFTLQQVG